MTKILFPTDFSENANNALKYAEHIVATLKAELILFDAWEMPNANSSLNMPSEKQIESHIKKRMQELLARLRKSDLVKNLPIRNRIKKGKMASLVKNMVKEEAIDLVIMGTKGASGLRKILMGSNTAAVIEKADVPVLCVPEKATFNNLKKIVFTTDIRDYNLPALKESVEFAKKFDAEVIITHIGDTEFDKRDELSQFKKLIMEEVSYEKISYKYFSSLDLVDGLNHYVENNDIDLVAMTTKRRSFFRSLLEKSITKEMVYHTKVPLLVFQAKAKK